VESADKLLPINEGARYIGIYGSSYSTARSWNFWGADEWTSFIFNMRLFYPDATFVIIGAEWDLDLSTHLIANLAAENVKYINTVGTPLSVVIEMMKKLELFIGFPSGLSILNETLAARGTFMFYPEHLQPMMNAWADPRRIESGAYTAQLFCTPDEAMMKICEVYQLQVKEPEPPTKIEKIAEAFGVQAPDVDTDVHDLVNGNGQSAANEPALNPDEPLNPPIPPVSTTDPPQNPPIPPKPAEKPAHIKAPEKKKK
jgi:hypothetical protein